MWKTVIYTNRELKMKLYILFLTHEISRELACDYREH